MKELIEGIYSKFSAANTFNTYIGGRMYLEEAPQGVTWPYATFHMDNAVHEWQFKTDYYDVSILFNLFSNDSDASEVLTMHDYLTDLYDDSLLTITGHSHVYSIERFGTLAKEFDNNLKRNIWQYSVEYGVYIKAN